MIPKSKLPPPKYRIGSRFKSIDDDEIYTLSEVKLDTYILKNPKGLVKGESLFTLEYDYELLQEGTFNVKK